MTDDLDPKVLRDLVRGRRPPRDNGEDPAALRRATRTRPPTEVDGLTPGDLARALRSRDRSVLEPEPEPEPEPESQLDQDESGEHLPPLPMHDIGQMDTSGEYRAQQRDYALRAQALRGRSD